MSIKIALKYLIKTANPLVDFGPSLDPQAAPREAYERFFKIHEVPVVVVNSIRGAAYGLEAKKVYTLDNIKENLTKTIKYYEHLEKPPELLQTIENLKILREDAVNIIFKETKGSGKSPQFIIHDFFHCFFEEESSELDSLNSSMDELFSPELYYDAFKNDYDLTPLDDLNIPKQAWLKAFKSTNGVGSVYHNLASMIPKEYWHLGATLAGVLTGEWFTSDSISSEPEKAYPDALADLIAMFFDPSEKVKVQLNLEPLHVMYLENTETISISRRNFPGRMITIYPKKGNSNISGLLHKSINHVLDKLDEILKKNIGKVMVIE